MTDSAPAASAPEAAPASPAGTEAPSPDAPVLSRSEARLAAAERAFGETADPIEGDDEAASPSPEAAPEDKADRSYRSLRRKQEKLKREREAFAAERTSLEREKLTIAEERQLAARFRQLAELSQKDKLAAARELGLDYDTMTKELLEEASLDEPTKAMRREIAELKQEREKAARLAQEAQEREQQREARIEATEQITKVASNRRLFPFAADLDEKALMRKADSVIDEAKAAKIDLREVTYADVVEVIEKRQAAKAEYWRKKLGMSAAEAKATVAAEPAAAAKEAPAKPSARRTLSSKDSGNASRGEARELTREQRFAKRLAMIPD